ncbi:MAG TPA: ABC transporter substrate-binding protein [Candidatus Binatia bacterium]|nr:ABC transporter substrate-binding protein [Candidatus Binatia bacterium]
MNRTLAQAATLIALFALSVGPASPAPEPYVIDVLINGTGANAWVGQTESEALRVYEKFANSQGGINGQPVHFELHDDQTEPRVAVQLANQLLAKHPLVILGSGQTQTCAAIAPLMEKGPVNYCFTPGYSPKPGGYVFSASASLHRIMPAVLRFSRGKRWYHMAMITTTTASGQASDLESKYALSLPENRDVKIVAWESFNPSDVTVTAQVARIKAAEPQVVFTPASGAAFATLLRALNDAGLHIPIITSAANEQPDQLKQVQSILPRELYLNGMLYYAADTIKRGALKTAIDQFYGAFKAAGVKPTPDSGQAWDPALIVVSALRKLGTSTTAEKLRDYILNLHDFPGSSGMYDFRLGDQHGLDDSAVIFVRWDSKTEDFVNASRFGGAAL